MLFLMVVFIFHELVSLQIAMACWLTIAKYGCSHNLQVLPYYTKLLNIFFLFLGKLFHGRFSNTGWWKVYAQFSGKILFIIDISGHSNNERKMVVLSLSGFY